MSNYTVSKIYESDKRANKQIDCLLKQEGIERDRNLDYTCAIYDDDMNIIATGSLFGSTLRCFAVSSKHQGEGLLNIIITHLIEIQHKRGNLHLFLYTKVNSAKFFGDLGFHEIATVKDQLVFMENRKNGFNNYLENLSKNKKDGQKVAALVMNANPFTLGHQYLVEKASKENDVLHIFIVSEDASLVPFNVRKYLVMEGTKHLNNICYHDSGPYIISNATFPSYFLKDETAVITGHALLDITIFKKIAETLGITRRYVGEEPNSQVTAIYNNIMKNELNTSGIDCVIIPRREVGGTVISASTVRNCLKNDDFDELKKLVPQTTIDYFLSDEAKPIIDKIKNCDNVIHY